ncbi:MAG: hypothetical protein ABIS14_10150 [Sphingomonas sp.]
MVRKFIKVAAMLSTIVACSVAHAANYGVTLSYVVPVRCSITYGAASAGMPTGDAIGLGALHEYCNAPKGYQLIVHYAPGSLRGMVLFAGDQRVTLDGSGQTVVDVSPIPQIRDRAIAAIPGPRGFDTDHLDFEAIAD